MSLSPSGRARLRACALSALAFLGMSHGASAQCPTVIRVPQDAANINAAAAQVCTDTSVEIVVAAGTWPATFAAPAGSSITVRGAGAALTTVIPESGGRFVSSTLNSGTAGRVTFSDLTLQQGAAGTANWRTSLVRCNVLECDGTFFPEGVTVQDCRFVDCQPVSGLIATPATLYLQPDTHVLRCEFNECFRPLLLWGEGGPLGHRLSECVFRSCTGNHVTIRSSCCANGANRTRIEQCAFDDFAAGSGTAIVFEANQAPGALTPILEVVDSTFRSVGDASVGSAGGAIRIGTPGTSYQSAMSSTTISGSTFTACHAGSGGAIFLSKYQPLAMSNCTFIGNSATSGPGGAMAQEFGGWDQAFSATGCTFIGNSATGEGGALRLSGWSGTANVSFCSFSYNSASVGGAINLDRRQTSLVQCQFIENIADVEDGGALYQFMGTVDIEDCGFIGNICSRDGGAAMIYSVGSLGVSDCSFTRNTAGRRGGALNVGREMVGAVQSCGFTGNLANERASAMSVFEGTTQVTVSNCTSVDNGPQTLAAPPAFLALSSASLTVASSQFCGSGTPAWAGVEGGTATDGGGNCVVAKCSDTDANGVPDGCQVVSVPGDFPSIQAAIDATPAGEYRQISLAEGIYQGPISLNGRRVAIRGAGAASTIIQGTGGTDTSVVRAVGEPAGARIEGVTIRGGLAGSALPGQPSIRVGGGIFADQSALVLSDCVVEGNTSGLGGGAYFRDCTGAIVNSVVRNNTAVAEGGGIHIAGGSVAVENTRVESNVANSRGGGAQVTGGNTVMRLVNITANQSGNVAGGLSFTTLGAPGAPPANLLVDQCTIESNTAAVVQGGVGILDDTPQTVQAIFSSTRICTNVPSPNIAGPWLNSGGNEVCDCIADVTRDGRIDGIDLATLLSEWGPATGSTKCDFNGSGTVDGNDLAFMLAAWGTCGSNSLLSVSAVSPASGPPAGGTVITITGTNMLGVNSVTIGGTAASNVQVVGPTTVTAVVPAGVAGSRDVRVATPSASATLASGFTYASRSVPSWATLIEPLPPSGIVVNSTLRDAIAATGFAWRVRDTATQVEMVLIPPGNFSMGCTPSSQFGCSSHENPVHQISLTQPFYLGRYEVTQAQWTQVAGNNPSLFAGQPDSATRPVEQVSWFTIQSFLAQTGLRLPTEAEWEFAYRAGTSTAYHGFVVDGFTGYVEGTNSESLLSNIAWFSGSGAARTYPVGQKASNGFGLHDMSGNVWEFVSDWYSASYYSSSPAVNPTGPADGAERVFRGGSWFSSANACRSSWRGSYPPLWGTSSVGFRVARNITTSAQAPTLSAVSPSSGPTTGGTTITLTGTNLLGTTSVSVSGAAATNVQVVSATTVTAVTPAGTAGARDVTVTTPGGAATLAGSFSYVVPAPTLTSVSPPNGPTTGGTTITLTGTNLTGTTSVTVGGAAATNVQVVNATTVTAVTPAGAAGPRDVTVTTPGGAATLAGVFTYAASAPTLTSVSPTSGLTTGGTTITLTGTNLTGATSVTIGGAAATSVQVVNATTVTAVTPAGSAGARDVTVTTPSGAATLAGAFSYVVPAPTLSAVSPTSGPTTGGTTITLTGTNLLGTTSVTVGGTAATSVQVVNSTTVTAVTPAGTAGARDVAVTTPGGTATRTGGFTYQLAGDECANALTAVIGANPFSTVSMTTSPDPVNEMQCSGTSLGWGTANKDVWFRFVPSGNGFLSIDTCDIASFNTSMILYSGTSCSDKSQIACNGDADEAWVEVCQGGVLSSIGPVAVTAGTTYWIRIGGWDGGAGPATGTGTLNLRYAVAPTLSAVSPTSGPTTGGTAITLTGTNLTGATSVTVGGTAATNVQVVNATTVTAVTPAGTAGARDVTVITPGGTATLPGSYTYVTVPTWATLLDASPDPSVITSTALRSAIAVTGLAWRVRDTATQIEFVLVPPGTYQRGCSPSDLHACSGNENPVHSVTLTQPFYMGRYEVTQAQWQARMGSNPSVFQSASAQVPANQVSSRPVEQVSWNMIQGFLSSTGMRLPTEAEWEYAYRADTTTAFHSMPDHPNGTNADSLLGNIAWIGSNAVSQPRPVGLKAANALGLHDMSGNVSEWVSDWIGTYPSGAVTNPTGPSTGALRVYRGGGYFDSANCRASHRSSQQPTGAFSDVGFRVARNP